MIKAKISISIITCMLTLCSCGHNCNMTDEEREKYMQEENRRDLRGLTTNDQIGF